MSVDALLAAVAALPVQLRALEERLERLERKIDAQAVEPLLPLAKILAISPRAALGRLARDPELRALGHRSGRRLLFRPSEVRQHLAQKHRERSSLEHGVDA